MRFEAARRTTTTQGSMAMEIRVGVVVPVYSGANYLERLVDRISQLRIAWQERACPYRLTRLVFVVDAAIDGSEKILNNLSKQKDWVTVVILARNFGQHPATMAGISANNADWIVTMDEDLQHPPEKIEDLLRRCADTSADIVYGCPERRVHGGIVRDLASRAYKWLIEEMTGNPHIRKANSFRLIRGSIAREAAHACGHDTYFDIALAWFTNRIEMQTMDLRDERHIQSGRSGYNLQKLLSHARRMAISSHLRVLRLGAFVGFALFGLSILGSIGLLLLWLLSASAIPVAGWTSLFLLNCLVGGIVLMLLGIVMEYISSLVLRAHGIPRFFAVDRSSDAILRSHFEKTYPG